MCDRSKALSAVWFAMPLTHTLALAIIALAVEAAVGYPPPLYRATGHPVTWMGRLIAWLEQRLNREGAAFALRRAAGVLALLVLLAVTAGVALAVQRAALALGPVGAFLLLPMLASALLAQRSLHEHVAAVRDALQREGLEAGRRAVSMIVGRNTAVLDEAGVCRAAIDSLAENHSDGITAPAFWLAVAGLPGAALYKAINTADSMIGHRSARYHAFGWAAARLDDLVNLPASRLTALLLTLAALGPGTTARGAARAVWRDAGNHRSPNAGWPEAAMAGALGLKLNGPRVYGQTQVDDHYMGDGRRDATAEDIDRALRLYRRALILQGVLLGMLFIAVAAR